MSSQRAIFSKNLVLWFKTLDLVHQFACFILVYCVFFLFLLLLLFFFLLLLLLLFKIFSKQKQILYQLRTYKCSTNDDPLTGVERAFPNKNQKISNPEMTSVA